MTRRQKVKSNLKWKREQVELKEKAREGEEKRGIVKGGEKRRRDCMREYEGRHERETGGVGRLWEARRPEERQGK